MLIEIHARLDCFVMLSDVETPLNSARFLDPDEPLTQFNVACSYSILGDLDAVLDTLEHAVPRCGPELVTWTRHDSDFDPLRNHPRFQEILEAIE